MWRVWRAARTAYVRRPAQEWRETGASLGSVQGNSLGGPPPVPDHLNGRMFTCGGGAVPSDQGGVPAAPTERRGEEALVRKFRAGSIFGKPAAKCGFSHVPVPGQRLRAFSSEAEKSSDEEDNDGAAQDFDGEDDEDTEDADGKTPATKGANTSSWALISMVSRLPRRDNGLVARTVEKWEASSKKNKLNKPKLIAVVRAMKKQERYTQILELVDWYVKKNPKEKDGSFLTVQIDTYSKLRNTGLAEMTFRKSEAALKTPSAYNALLAAYVSASNTKKAEAFFQEMKEADVANGAFPFNQMVIMFKNEGLPEKVPEVLEEMKQRGIKHDVFTYNILIDMESKAGNIDKVEELHKLMKAEAGLSPDASTSAVLILAYARAEKWDTVAELLDAFDKMPSRGKLVAYDILMRSFANLGSLEYVEKVWEMVKKGPRVPPRCFCTMIQCYGKLNLESKAEELFEELKKKPGGVSIHAYNSLLSVYKEKGDDMQKAEELVAKLDAQKQINRNSLTNHILVTSYLRGGHTDKALKVLDTTATSSMRSKTVPWYQTLAVLLESYGEKGDYKNAEKLFAEIKRTYKRVSPRIYNAVLQAYANAGERPAGFVERMEADSVKPNEETEALLVKAGLKEPSQKTKDAQEPASEAVLSASS